MAQTSEIPIKSITIVPRLMGLNQLEARRMKIAGHLQLPETRSPSDLDPMIREWLQVLIPNGNDNSWIS